MKKNEKKRGAGFTLPLARMMNNDNTTITKRGMKIL